MYQQEDSSKSRVFRRVMALTLTVCLVFLQSGFTYYLSFQTLALGLLVFVIFAARPRFVGLMHQLVVVTLLASFTVATAFIAPTVISRNSPDMVGTVLKILTFASFPMLVLHFRFKSVESILEILRSSTALVIIILSCLLVVADSNLIPQLSQKSLLLQNATLVTNFASEQMLQNELSYVALEGIRPRVDLFYGEPSYLAVVIFISAVSYLSVLRLSLIRRLRDRVSGSIPSLVMTKAQRIVLALAVLSLLYLQSLSSLIYAFILMYFVLRKANWGSLSFSRRQKMIVLVMFGGFFAAYGADYLMQRVFTLENSLSLFQRFGPFLQFGLPEYVWGLHNPARLPDVGLHNGLAYIIAISGVAGIYYVYMLLRSGSRLSRYTEMRPLVFISTLALIMQNGAVFSPNKAVLFALIFLPLSCVRSILHAAARRL